MSKTISDGYLLKKIAMLKSAAHQYRSDNRPGQRRYWMYGYLEHIYRVFLGFQKKGISKRARKRIIKLSKLSIRKKSHILRILVEASAGPEDNRTKIKWANALRFAHGWQQPVDRLRWFFGANGGIAGCAAKFASLKKARRQRGPREKSLRQTDCASSDVPGQLAPPQGRANPPQSKSPSAGQRPVTMVHQPNPSPGTN